MDGDDLWTALGNGLTDGAMALDGGAILGKLGGMLGNALGNAGGRLGGWMGKSLRWMGGALGASQCFAAGTLVTMADGSTKPIEQVKVGDWVASRDSEQAEKSKSHLKSKESVGKEVTRRYVTEQMRTVKVSFSNGEVIQCTSGHPFYVVGKGFTPAGRLAIGNSIITRAGPNVTVRKIEQGGVTTVYNFEVEGTHAYFVGKTGAWVHNTAICEDLFAFGNAQGPRLPRPGSDFTVGSDGNVVPGPAAGGSTFNTPEPSVPINGPRWKLPAGTELPDGLGSISDGGTNGHAPGHNTIYPTKPMPPDEFRNLFGGLPWERAGSRKIF